MGEPLSAHTDYRWQRRRLAHRLLVVLAAGFVVQVGGWAAFGDTPAAGVLIVLGHAALPLLGAAWLPRPPGGFVWRLHSDDGRESGLDRMWAVMTFGPLLTMQPLLLWSAEREVPVIARLAMAITPALLMYVMLEARRRWPRR